MADVQGIITKKYGETPLFDRLSFTVPAGKTTCLLGASGVGKTTLCKILAGIEPFDGEITGAEGGVSYVFQEDRLIPSFTVLDNVLLVRKKGEEIASSRARAEELLAALGIAELKDRFPQSLSGGQKQRVAIARAFFASSDLLLLDEPFRSLDVGLKQKMIAELNALAEREKKTVLYVTHGVDEALLAADNVLVFGGRPAKIVQNLEITIPKADRSLTMEELSPYRAALLSALVG